MSTIDITNQQLASNLLSSVLQKPQTKPKFPNPIPHSDAPRGLDAIVPANLRWLAHKDGSQVARDDSYTYRRVMIRGQWQYSRRQNVNVLVPDYEEAIEPSEVVDEPTQPRISTTPVVAPPDLVRIETGTWVEVSDDYVHIPPERHVILTVDDMRDILAACTRRSSRPPAK